MPGQQILIKRLPQPLDVERNEKAELFDSPICPSTLLGMILSGVLKLLTLIESVCLRPETSASRST